MVARTGSAPPVRFSPPVAYAAAEENVGYRREIVEQRRGLRAAPDHDERADRVLTRDQPLGDPRKEAGEERGVDRAEDRAIGADAEREHEDDARS